MAERARHPSTGLRTGLVEEVFGAHPVRQWVLSFPYPLRFLFASKPEAIGPVLGIVHRLIAGWLADQAGVKRVSAQCGGKLDTPLSPASSSATARAARTLRLAPSSTKNATSAARNVGIRSSTIHESRFALSYGSPWLHPVLTQKW